MTAITDDFELLSVPVRF